MRRIAFGLISAFALAAQGQADEAPLRGTADFAGGRGQITLNGGIADYGVEQVGTGLAVFVDGEAVSFDADDRVTGSTLGGRLSYILKGGGERTWLGRDTRLILDVAHGWADSDNVDFNLSALTVDDSLFFHASSADGRAMAYSSSTTTGAAAFTTAYGAGSTFNDVCTDANGGVSASAVATGLAGAVATCSAGAAAATSESDSSDGATTVSAASHAVVLSGTPFAAAKLTYASYDIEDTRFEAAMAGDRDLSPALRLTPSVALVGGRRQLKFVSENGISAADGATNSVAIAVSRGGLVSKDFGAQAGSSLTYALAPGIDLFASAKAAVLHRSVHMDSAGGMFGAVDGFGLGAISTLSEHMENDADRTAFQGRFETGGSYQFDTGFLGPLRLGLTGGLTYDSAVAHYEAVKSSPALDPPFAPAGIGFASEIDFFARAELTLELP